MLVVALEDGCNVLDKGKISIYYSLTNDKYVESEVNLPIGI